MARRTTAAAEEFGGDAHLGDVVPVPDRAHRPVTRKQQVRRRGLGQTQEGQELVPRPVVLVQCPLSGHELGEEAMCSGTALGEIGRRVQEQFLDEQIVLDCVAEEDRSVDVGVVECARVRFVFQQGRAGDVEHLQCQSGGGAQPRVGSGVRRAVGEADERVVGSRSRVDSLGVLGGQPVQDLHFPSDQPVALGMGVAKGPPGAAGLDRLGDVALGLLDHRLHVAVEVRVVVFDVRRVADELCGHDFDLSSRRP